MKMDYWKECIEEALEDSKLNASEDQIQNITNWVESAHDNYSMATGSDCIPDPVNLENEALRKELKAEREKVICRECNGNGRITEQGPVHSYNSECSNCRGEGRHRL
jgi:hypothetical protein